MEHRRLFLQEKTKASRKAGQAIEQQFTLLEANPEIGRPLDDHPELRELVIVFGGAGYVVLYRYELKMDAVFVLAFRHQREVGF